MKKETILKKIQKRCANTFVDTLDIKFIEIGEDYLIAKMPVTPSVLQLDGVLHGGATAGLAETVGSAACAIFRGDDDIMIRGIEISANHLQSVRSGHVYAKSLAVHMGKTMQHWHISITDDNDQLVSSCKLTTLSLNRKK
jgi:uncharacterized protein (TIGR00369 family)